MTDDDKIFSEIDQEKQNAEVSRIATAKAEEIAKTKVDELKDSLIQSISGKTSRYGKSGPESWDKLHDDIKTDTLSEVQKATEPLRKELEQLKREKEEESLRQSRADESMRTEKQRIDQEWKELVEDGDLPKIAPEIMEKINKNEKLSDDEVKDPGLMAYNEIIKTHFETNRGGSLYRTLKHNLSKQPAGSRAPVLGGRSKPTENNEDEYTYEEIHNAAKEMGWTA